MSNLPAKKEETSIVDTMKEQVMMEVIDSILPKLQPFIAPAMEKLNEYFGDDEKIFIIRRSKGQAAKVIVLDNTKGEYSISNEVDVTGKLVKSFTADKEAIINVFDTGQFVQKLLSGEFTGAK